jgi:hypothetical protein
MLYVLELSDERRCIVHSHSRHRVTRLVFGLSTAFWGGKVQRGRLSGHRPLSDIQGWMHLVLILWGDCFSCRAPSWDDNYANGGYAAEWFGSLTKGYR